MQDYRVGYVVDTDGAVIAVFLDSAPRCQRGELRCHAREHPEKSAAWVSYIETRPPAAPQHYHDLHEELSRRFAGACGSGLYGCPDHPVNLVLAQEALPRRSA